MLGNNAFANYNNASTTGQAIKYRELTRIYDIIALSAGAGGIGFSILLLVNLLSDNRDPEIKQKIADLKAQIVELEAR